MTEPFPEDSTADPVSRSRRSASDIATMLAGVVGRLRTPLSVLVIAPVVPILILIVVAITADAPAGQIGGTIAAIAVIPPVWLAIRRRQLLAALEPPEAAVAEIRAAFSARDIADQVRGNLVALRGAKIRPRTVAVGLWRGVAFGIGLQQRFTDVPRLQPFLPGRLRGLAFLAAACLGSTVVVGLLDALLLVLWIVGLI